MLIIFLTYLFKLGILTYYGKIIEVLKFWTEESILDMSNIFICIHFGQQ